MTSVTTLSFAEVRAILSTFFDLPEDAFKGTNGYGFNVSASQDYLEEKLKENTKKFASTKVDE